MEGKSDVLAVVILERDRHDEVLVTWAFPAIEPALEPVLIARSGLVVSSGGGGGKDGDAAGDSRGVFRFSKFRSLWHYMLPAPCGSAAELAAAGGKQGATARAVCVLSRRFQPEKFEGLLALLAPLAHDPTKVLQAHLTAFTTGKCASPGGSGGGGAAAAAAAKPPPPPGSDPLAGGGSFPGAGPGASSATRAPPAPPPAATALAWDATACVSTYMRNLSRMSRLPSSGGSMSLVFSRLLSSGG